MTKGKKIIIQDEDDIEEIDEKLDEEEEEFISQDISLEDRLINIEKKSNITLFLILVTFLINIILLFGIFNGSKNNNTTSNNINYQDNPTTQETNISYDTTAMKEITATDIASESKKETIIVVIGRQGCSACAEFIPILTEVAKEYNTTVRYIDLAKIVQFTSTVNYITDDEAYDTLIALTGDGKWETFAKDNIGYTPLTLIIKNNKVTGGIGGVNIPKNANDIESALDAAGLKK